jgi:hypothetical protein
MAILPVRIYLARGHSFGQRDPMHPMKFLSGALHYTVRPTGSAILPSLSCRVRQTHSVTARSSYITVSTEEDPYQYQVGFGNRFASEAV